MSSWHVMLLLDNCPGHGSVSFMQSKVPDWVKIQLLPPNTTSIIQPCDGGAIMKLKRRYRRHLLRHIHASAYRDVTEFKKHFNMWHVVALVAQAAKELQPEELAAIWDRTVLGPLCLKAQELSEEEAQQQLSERWNTEPGEWVRDLQPEEQKIEEELNSLAAMLGNCQIVSEEVDVWLQIEEAIKSADPEGISLDDAIDAVLGGLTSLELATAGEGSDDDMGYEQGGGEEDGSDEEGSGFDEAKSGGRLSGRQIMQTLIDCAIFFDRKGDNPMHGQLCRDLAFEAQAIMERNRAQSYITQYFGQE